MAAYNLSGLAEELKKEGLEVAEQGAKSAFEATMRWLKASAAESENKFDDVVVGVMAPLEAYVLEQIDKIDGEVG